MARQLYVQSDFTGGELSPDMYGRIALDRYAASAKTLTNFVIQPQGPVKRRNGSKYIAAVKDSTKTVRLIPFKFSETDTFVLEFGNTYIRFYTDQAQVQSGGSPYEISSPWDQDEVLELSFAQIANVIYIVHPDHAPRTLTRNSSTDWVLSTIVFNPPPVRELGEQPATTCTPAATTGTAVNFTAGASTWLASDVGRQIVNNSSGETGRAIITSISSATVAVAEIIEAFTDTNAIASGDWTLALSPICELNVTAGNGKLGEQITLDSEDVTSAAAQDAFRTTVVGMYIRMQNGLIKITQRTDVDTVVGTVVSALDATTATTNWTLEQEIWDSTNGYPRAVGIYQQRLVFGGTAAYPQSLWLSATGVFDLFAGGAQDSDSLDLTPASDTVNRIEWLQTTKDLVVGTSGSEFVIRAAPGSSTALSPTNVDLFPSTDYGSTYPQRPIKVGNRILFIQENSKKIRAYNFNLNSDNYSAADLNFFAQHLSDEGIKEMIRVQNPDSLLYAVTDSGNLLVSAYMPELDNPILGWTKWTTDGTFENVATIPNDGRDEVWVVVNRTINGSTKRYIEVFDASTGEATTDGFSDCYLTLSNPKTITDITEANPAVVTSAAHGLSNGDTVRITGVSGMTEVNGLTFLIGGVTTNTFKLEQKTHVSIRSSSYQWTASGSGTNEYYLEVSGGGDPGISAVVSVYEDDTALTAGTAGSLSASEWDYADNDSLGYSTIYVRLADGADPDDKGQGWVEYGPGLDASAYTAYVSGGTAYEQVTTISGLSHLEGETVQVKLDGASHPDKIVSSGAITLSFSGGEAVVGLPYTATLQTLEPPFSSNLGPLAGQEIKINNVKLRLYKSAKPTVNSDFSPARISSDELDEKVPLFTGDVQYGPGSWDDAGVISITQSLPFPLVVQAIMGNYEVGVR